MGLSCVFFRVGAGRFFGFHDLDGAHDLKQFGMLGLHYANMGQRARLAFGREGKEVFYQLGGSRGFGGAVGFGLFRRPIW